MTRWRRRRPDPYWDPWRGVLDALGEIAEKVNAEPLSGSGVPINPQNRLSRDDQR